MGASQVVVARLALGLSGVGKPLGAKTRKAMTDWGLGSFLGQLAALAPVARTASTLVGALASQNLRRYGSWMNSAWRSVLSRKSSLSSGALSNTDRYGPF